MNNIVDIIPFLKKHGYYDCQRIAQEIVEYSRNDKKKLKRILERIATQEPWEYIRGWSEFRGLKLRVNSNVLIPRIETEQIVDILKQSNLKGIKEIIDVGTGSGALAISISKEIRKVKVTAIDISLPALITAMNNAFRNTQRINFRFGNLLRTYKPKVKSVVVANLPYVPMNIYHILHKSVKNFEPKLALTGGEDGLDLIKKLLTQSEKIENIKSIILEIDPKQKEPLKRELKKYQWSYKFIKDFRGLIRFLKLNR